MNLLLNGCSFLECHHYKEHLDFVLGCTTTNLAKPGSSNRRIIRTTVDYCETHHPDFVLLGLTFYDRQEGPFLTVPKDRREGAWVSYNSQGFQGTFITVNDFGSELEYKMTDDYIKTRYRYDIGAKYLEQLYLDLRMLAAYFQTRGIGYCIFNMCDRHHEPLPFPNDPGFVPFDFIGNQFLQDNGCKHFENDSELPKNARHHYGKDTIILVEYLLNYIQEKQLIERGKLQMSVL